MRSCSRHPKGPLPGCEDCEVYSTAYDNGYLREAMSSAPHLHHSVRCRPSLTPFTIKLVMAGESVEMEATAFCSFRPTWLVIPRHVGTHLHVRDIQQGCRSLLARPGDVHALCFRETLTEKNRIPLGWDTILPGSRVTLRVANASAKPVLASAYLLGHEAL